jgi:hypothetical protein
VETFEPDLPAGSAYGGGKPDTGFQVYRAPVVRVATGETGLDRRRQLRLASTDTNGPRGGVPLTPQQIEAQKQKQLQALEAAKALSNSVTRILVTCRMVNRDKISGSANQDLAFAVQSNLMASPSFSSTNVLLGTNGIKVDPADTNTATFDLSVGLKNPLKL